MFRARRTIEEPRLEIMPLIDVIFLLLTFFIFALVLMVRADVLNINAPALSAGRRAEPGPVITVALDAEGRVHVNGEPVDREQLIPRVERLRERLRDDGEPPRLFVAADQDGRSGDLLDVMDALVGAGLDQFSVVGRPAPDSDSPGGGR